MLKRRGLLIGLGLGLMIGASSLQLMLAAEKGASSLNLSDASLTREELREAAEAQGFALVDAAVKTYTQEELDAAVQKAGSDAQAAGGTDGIAGSGADEAATGPASSAASPASSPADSSAASSEEEHTYSFYIRAKASLLEVATGLEELGLIDDKEQFAKQAAAYSKSLRVGTCLFVGKPTYEEIIAEITRAKY
ncbi:hypothetical protein [Cohnella fermenti]|uniref:Endolytic transglycosylase MltG n=1 Tax=Cohnella fermenti TaxID=2565925 RepID=A0A4S4C176_9BACL|nr:hypothetical protein [Cohnella fermenti]THF81238.1 hypothetical protein E6C55_08985 [Cohnella fermenti]